MTVPTVSCTNCGKNFTTDDLRGTNCRYCGTLFTHHARAAQQVAVVNQMLADRNGNGIPDAFEGIVANAQANAMNQAFGINATPYTPYNPYNPYGQPGPTMGPVVQIHGAHMQQVAHATRTANKMVTIAIVAAVIVIMLSLGIGIASMLLVG